MSKITIIINYKQNKNEKTITNENLPHDSVGR